jgi:uracil-DNA glycosylase
MNQRVNLSASWLALLGDQFDLPYMQQLRDFLLMQKRQGKQVYPPGEQMFAALNAIAVDDVRVVVIGQDPYHGPGQAHGLSFSVPHGVAIPPSLRNIFKEIGSDIGLQETVKH